MDKLNWRETLSWRVGVRRALAGNAYKCPWWANEPFYRLAYRMVYRVDIPDPVGEVSGAATKLASNDSELARGARICAG
jgi:hypothetical protein